MEIQNVIVLADIPGALNVQLARLLHILLPSQTHIVVVVHHFRLHELGLEVRVDVASSIHHRRPVVGVPRARLVCPHRVERVQP